MRIWVESSGGPPALVPAEALHEWTGVNGGEQRPIVDVGGPMVLIDAAAPGPEARIDQARGEMGAEAISVESVEIEPGLYRVDRGEVSPDERTRLRCYRFEATAVGRSGDFGYSGSLR